MIDVADDCNSRGATLFLRLEGPMQSWGGRTIGPFRRTERVPTKSGVMGLLGAALGLHRSKLNQRLGELDKLVMGVRVDRAGHVGKDYQTIGAGIGILSADGRVKQNSELRKAYPDRKVYRAGKLHSIPDPKSYEPIISPREYLIDASFLVVLRGEGTLIEELASAMRKPAWPLFLGRKRCVPGTCVFAGVDAGLTFAEAVRRDGPEDHSLLTPDESQSVRVVTDLIGTDVFGDLVGLGHKYPDQRYEQAKWYVTDRLMRVGDPPVLPVHAGRIVLDFEMPRVRSTLERPNLRDSLFGLNGGQRLQRANDAEARKAARAKSGGRCVFCRFEPADPRDLHAHHLTYIRRGRERVTDDWDDIQNDDLLMVCSECHAAITMLEYQSGFGVNRIDPQEARWHARIGAARELRRRDRNPTHPFFTAGAGQDVGVDGKPDCVVETRVSLKAGGAYAANSPGNRWLTNRQHVHQRLSMAFPEAGGRFAARGYGVTRDKGGFLFRIEPGPITKVVVRSRILPDWGRAFANAGWLVEQRQPAPRLVDLRAFPEGTELVFDLEANPVKRLQADGPEGRKGSRVPLRHEDALAQWMNRRARDGGFEILDRTLTIERVGRQTATKRSVGDRHWDAVRFKGLLRVADWACFAAMMRNGIGPAKAFGFGLLSVAPVREGG